MQQLARRKTVKILSDNQRKTSPRFLTFILVAGFLLSVLVRVIVGGIGVSQSPIAGIIFALLLFGMICLAGIRITISRRSVAIGVLGGIILCLPSLLHRIGAGIGHRPEGNFLTWGIVVTIVALTEEGFLRGTLFDAVCEWKGSNMAVIIGAIAFTILHIPLYGWYIVPLEFVVGLWLGILRASSDSPLAPGIAHVAADLAGWWLR